MADTDDAYACDANEALEISLVKPSSKGLQTLSTFNPAFTYPIFGEDERIFGYQGLKIKLRYHANDMRPHLQVTSSRKYPAVGDTAPTDIQALMKPFLPQVAFQKTKDFEAAIQALPTNWTPPGECIQELQSKDDTYEIWKGSLDDPAMMQMLKRIEIMAPIFIEGGSLIELEKGENLDRWSVFLLYRKQNPAAGGSGHASYDFAGYVTAYRFFVFLPPKAAATHFDLPTGDFDLNNLPCRSRISQFIILPPHRKKGLASQLYSAVYQYYLHHSQTCEITVEDPNEAFDDLRDLADLAYLRTKDAFNKLHVDPSIKVPLTGKVPTILDPAALEALRSEAKMSARQFSRVLEMHLMSQLAETLRPNLEGIRPKGRATTEQQKAYNLWKLFVKQRLYRRNRDQLEQLEDRGERVQKLDDSLGSVELEYARLLSAFESRKKLGASSTSGKRKAVDEEGSSSGPSSKKARVDNAA